MFEHLYVTEPSYSFQFETALAQAFGLTRNGLRELEVYSEYDAEHISDCLS